jgi:MFS transporter, FSR family, fosmidomycin resistance protein
VFLAGHLAGPASQLVLYRHRIGTASGVTLGLALSIGGLATPLFGLLADSRGLTVTLATLAALPAVSLVLAGRLREPRSAVA